MLVVIITIRINIKEIKITMTGTNKNGLRRKLILNLKIQISTNIMERLTFVAKDKSCGAPLSIQWITFVILKPTPNSNLRNPTLI